jgi:uncharacterized protein YoxC
MKRLEKKSNAGLIGYLVILVALVIVGFLVFKNWDSIDDAVREKKEETTNTMDHMKEQIKDVEEKMKERLPE